MNSRTINTAWSENSERNFIGKEMEPEPDGRLSRLIHYSDHIIRRRAGGSFYSQMRTSSRALLHITRSPLTQLLGVLLL